MPDTLPPADPTAAIAAPAAATKAAPTRKFGRFELRALLNKSVRSMLWLVYDERASQELMLCMPRVAPNSPAAAEHWQKTANAGSRVRHPNLAHVVEIGQVEQWPYVAYDRALGETLDERLARSAAAPLPVEAAEWICQYLEGLAFAHEAGHAHRDVQAATMIISPTNQVRVVGLEVAQEVFPANLNFNTVTRRAVRESAEEDVLSVGLLLHRILSGKPVLDQGDLHTVIQQMQPVGHEVVRLGWETPYPIPDPLRAITNRATDRQTRQRYHIARSFLRALDGWRTAANSDDGGPIALLMDRLQRVGHLPSTSTALNAIAESSRMSAQHISALSELVLKDMALSLELLRRVNNSLKQQGAPVDGTVLNLQRAIAMLGLNGVQEAARSLKPWPGVLAEQPAIMLRKLMDHLQRAGQIAQALRPAGYDGEVVYLITVMQSLGRLLVTYHFPEDAQQIRQLIQPLEPTPDHPNPAPMTEQAGAYAVLGCDLDTLGQAVARYWSLGEELQHMIRRQGADVPVRHAESDAELLRLTCSLANELADALLQPEPPKRQAAIETATKRYSRVLHVGLREVQLALNPDAAAAQQAGSLDLPPAVAVPKASPLRDRLAPSAAGGAPAAASPPASPSGEPDGR